MMIIQRLLGAVALVVFALAAPPGHAQSLAGKTIRFIVPFPPGGSADVIARIIGQQAAQGGPNIVVENRPGGGTVIATEYVSHATPDGTTLLFMANSFVINPSVRPNLNYDPLTSFDPICLLVSSPQILVANGSSPLRSLKDFVDAAKARPGVMSYAAVGPATTQHIAMEQFKRLADVNVTYVPYTGGAPAINALLGAHVDAVMANYSEIADQIAAGKLRALAVATRERFAALPEVPTFVESGFPDYEATAWFGVVTPAKTPKEMTARLAAMFAAALAAPEVSAKLVGQGLLPIGQCGAPFAAHIKAQYGQYAEVIRDANIKGE